MAKAKLSKPLRQPTASHKPSLTKPKPALPSKILAPPKKLTRSVSKIVKSKVSATVSVKKVVQKKILIRKAKTDQKPAKTVKKIMPKTKAIKKPVKKVVKKVLKIGKDRVVFKE